MKYKFPQKNSQFLIQGEFVNWIKNIFQLTYREKNEDQHKRIQFFKEDTLWKSTNSKVTFLSQLGLQNILSDRFSKMNENTPTFVIIEFS